MNENPYQSPGFDNLADGDTPAYSDSQGSEWPRWVRVATLGFVGFSTTSLLFWTLQSHHPWDEGVVFGAIFGAIAMSSEVLDTARGFKLSVILRIGLACALFMATCFVVGQFRFSLGYPEARGLPSQPLPPLFLVAIVFAFGTSLLFARQFLILCGPATPTST